jgi:replicative DNA helicase
MHPGVDADYATIGGLLLAPSQLDVVADWLRPEDFARPLCGEVFAVMVEMRGRSTAIDPVTVLGEFYRRGRVRADGYPGGELIAMVEAVPVPEAAPHYGRLVLEAATFRTIERCGARLTQVGRRRRGGVDDAFDTVAPTWREIAEIRERWQRSRPGPSRDDASRPVLRLEPERLTPGAAARVRE